MPTLSAQEPLDEGNPDHQRLLGDLQCNILSSHSRTNTHYFFLRFKQPDWAPEVLRKLALNEAHFGFGLESELGSRARRHNSSDWAKGLRLIPSNFSANLLLSASCYENCLPGFVTPGDRAFQHGMAGRDVARENMSKLNDPEPTRGLGLHALFMLGYDSEVVDLEPVKQDLLTWLHDKKVEVQEEEGYVLRHSTRGYPIEPFGYRDSISQPLFYKRDLESRSRYEGAAASVSGGKWSSFAPLSLALVPDPNGQSRQPCGSYFAYRKLRQDVKAFYDQASQLAQQIPARRDGTRLSPDDVADFLIGRRVDGHPLDETSNYNDFAFSDRSVCPMHAHIRKVNPRRYDERGRRIVRRSTVYGPRLQRSPDGRPVLVEQKPLLTKASKKHTDDIGLMFLCCQADIASQFEAIQAQWANDSRPGADPLIGQLKGAQNKIGFNGSGLRYNFSPVVQLLEGEYFFAPSLSFFSRLQTKG